MTKTTIQWATPFSLGLLLASALAAALVYALLRRAGGGPLAPARRWGLWALRGVILAVLAVILLNPVRVEETPGAVERPKVVYLVDTSQSMALGQGDRSRWSQVVSTLRESDRPSPAAPEVGVFRFGSRLAAVEAPFWKPPGSAPPGPIAAPAPTDSETLLSGSLETLAGRFGQSPPRAVVVFSDGRARDPDRAGSIARGYGRMGIPIHVVPVGDEAVGGDVAIVSMVVPNLVRKSTQVPVRVFVRSYGYKGRRAEVRLAALGPDGRPAATLARTPVVLKDGLADYAMIYESGEQDRRIVATVDPQPGEVSAENNSFAADVTIDRTKIRVLYVEGSNERIVTRKGLFGLGGPGEVVGAYTPLQQALTEDPDVECSVVVPVGAGDFSVVTRSDDRGRGLPETPSELFAYDAIILGDVPREVFDDKFMGWIDEWIGRRGGGLCMVGGPNSFGSGRWAGTPIGRMLPVEVEPGGSDWDGSPAAIRPVVGGAIHPIWHIAADDAANRTLLGRLPAFQGHNRLGAAKPTAEVIARVGTTDGGPAIAVQPYGRGRTMAMAAGTTPRLAAEFARSWGEGDSRYFKKYWRNAVYWLTENSSIGRRRLLAETDRRLYRPGEPIALRARAFDENAAPTLDYRIAVSIEPKSAADATSDNSPLRRPAAGPAPDDSRKLLPWGEEFNLARVTGDQSYAADLPIAEAKGLPTGVSLTGGIRIELTAYENNTQVDSTSIDVQVLDDPTEMQNPLPDHDLLGRIADGSGGTVLRGPKELAEMLARLPIGVGPTEVKKLPAWSRWWLLTTLIALLTVEWAWRRRVGLA